MKSLPLVFALLAMTAAPTVAQSPKHPLDGLTAGEHWTVYQALLASRKVDSKTRYPSIELKEPPKEEVLAWKAGQSMRREALAVVKQGPRTFVQLQAQSTPREGGSDARPTVVLVHGGFVDGSGWAAVFKLLRKQGFNVRIVQNPTLSLAGDVAATRLIISARDSRWPFLRRRGHNRGWE